MTLFDTQSKFHKIVQWNKGTGKYLVSWVRNGRVTMQKCSWNRSQMTQIAHEEALPVVST